jgi:hypothetical protein
MYWLAESEETVILLEVAVTPEAFNVYVPEALVA